MLTSDRQLKSPDEERSLYRVKMLCIVSGFLLCCGAIRFGFGNETLFFVLAMGLSVLPLFVRCETCKSSIYYRAGGRRALPVAPGAYTFVLASTCPYCGRKRI